MPDIRSIRAEIRARLVEVQKLLEPLEAEAEQLEKLAATFADHSATSAPSADAVAATEPARERNTRRAPKAAQPPGRSKRAGQAVAKIRERPGITTGELADAMGVTSNYLYRVLPRLEREDRVTKRGAGYHPTGNAGPAAATNGQPVKS